MSNGKGAAGRFQLHIDGKPDLNLDLDDATPVICGRERLSCGHDGGAPGAPQRPFDVTGTIRKVVVDVDVEGNLVEDDEARPRIVIAQQQSLPDPDPSGGIEIHIAAE